MRRHVVLSAAAVMAATSPAQAVPADFKAKADQLLKTSFPADQPGAAVIVTEDGKVVYKAGQGLADVEAKRPITPATVFRMGSITKQFSAAIMLQLVAEGKVSLDDRLSKFLPDYPKPGADATIAQLLNHTVGVQSYTGIPGWMGSDKPAKPLTTEQLVAEFKNLPSPFKPGEKWDYNNSGYVLVGAVIEKITGKPWHVAVEERIAKPLGLKTIRYGAVEASMANMARGYTEKDGMQLPARPIHMSIPHAAGALIGSVEDLAKWSHALHHGKVVRPDLYAKMIAPTMLPGGKTQDYGFGLAIDTVRGHKAIRHGGGIFGFSTEAIFVPGEDVFVALFTNSDDPVASEETVAYRLAALALGNPFPVFEKAEVDIRSLEPLFGVYSVDGGDRRFFARDGKLYTRRSGGSDLEVFAAGGNRFFYGPDNLTWFEIGRDAGGKPVMAMHQNGAVQPELASYAGPIPADPKTIALPRSALERYTGTYKAAPGPVKVAFAEGGGITLQLGPQRPVPMKPISATEFMLVGVDARVVFRTEGEKVVGLVLKQGGRDMPAERLPN